MKFILLLTLILTSSTFAGLITDSDFYKYDVFFTNPICKAYRYSEVTYANDGSILRSKPANVYCKRGDKKANYERVDSPNFNLRKLINNKDLKSLFLTYLSFSDSKVTKAVCNAIEKRNVAVTLIIDSKNNTDERRMQGAMAKFDQIAKCRPLKSSLAEGEKANIPKTMTRGNIGGLGYAHNKIIIANFKNQPTKTQIVFSSGNMSSGTILHHENWHFLTTSTNTYLYKVHLCIKDGMINHSKSKSLFKKFISSCRNSIKEEQESDIKVYIVPSDGKVAMDNLVANMKKAESIDVAVHRLTHPIFISGLMSEAKKKSVRLLVDDDVYWAGQKREIIGSSMPSESSNMNKVRRAGAEVRYMQTNEASRLLHHNKFVVFNLKSGGGAVHTGAGNFTKAAFSKNFENYYFITIPSVVAKFKRQYNHMFKELATGYSKLPATYSNP